MKIAVDINGVLFSVIDKFIDLFNDKHQTDYTKKDVDNWEFYYDWDVSEREFFELFYEAYENIMDIPFIDENASKYMKKLNQIHDVRILSAGNPQYRPQIVKKLNFHDVKEGEQYRELIIIKERPWDLKLTHDFDLYVDDNPNLVEPIKKKSGRYLLLFDQPWNQDSMCEKNVIRVHDWNEAYTTIRKLFS